MDMLNAVLTRTAEALLAVFRDHPATGLVFWSAITGVLMTYVFSKTSNQPGLRRAADTIRAQLYAIKLFKEDLVVTFQCQVRLLKSTGKRLLLSVPPMLVMIVPLLLLLVQLAMRYEYRPLVRGEQAVVAVQIKPEMWRESRGIVLRSGKGYLAETEALRDEQSSTVFWRIRADSDEPTELTWELEGRRFTKRLPLANHETVLTIANPRRSGDSFWDQLFYPAEPALAADAPITSIELQLERRETALFGLGIPWWATFFGISMLVALVTGKLTGVQY